MFNHNFGHDHLKNKMMSVNVNITYILYPQN